LNRFAESHLVCQDGVPSIQPTKHKPSETLLREGTIRFEGMRMREMGDEIEESDEMNRRERGILTS
jgi:hypothetical protein